MRDALAPLCGQRLTVRAEVVQRGKRIGWACVVEPTIMLGPVVTLDGTVLADHLWFHLGKRLKRVRPAVGDTLELCATVRPYRKTFYRKAGKPARFETDYGLAYPTKIKTIARANAGRSVTA